MPTVEIMNLTTEYSIGGYRVEPGVAIPHYSNQEQLRFDLFMVCDQVAPESWHGEVRFAGKVLIKTESVDKYEIAGRLAERALVERVVELFGGTDRVPIRSAH